MPGSNKSKFNLRRRTSVRKAQNLKLAFSEFYLSLILLQNYQSLNFMGFKKILKKHDKVRMRLNAQSVCLFSIFVDEKYATKLNVVWYDTLLVRWRSFL